MTVNRLSITLLHRPFSVRPGYLLFAGLAVSLCLALSFWQWQRAQDAEARYQHYLLQAEQPAVSIDNSPAEFQRVTVNGHIDRLMLLDNQIHEGDVGWHVIALLITDTGAVLVNLGWRSQAAGKPKLDEFSFIHRVTGRIKTPELGMMLAPAKADPNWPDIMQQIDIALLSEELGLPLAPFVVFSDSPAAELIAVQAAPENKYPMHIGYAIQWLLIALACLIATFFACRREAL